MRLPSGRRLDLDRRTHVMGVLNLTPDSFSDGGRFDGVDAVRAEADRMVAAGADILDFGGESTRPGAAEVDPGAEARRVVPALAAVRADHPGLALSIDTRRASVARAAIEAGADIVNDVSACRDEGMPPLLVETGAAVVLMHMRGEPRTMQADTRYDDLIAEVAGFLDGTARKVRDAGVAGDKIVVDPGIGFGKSVRGNLMILNSLPRLLQSGWPVLIGASRKSFIGKLLDLPVDERLEGSLAAAAVAAWNGAHIVRVHDVAQTVRVVRLVDAIRNS